MGQFFIDVYSESIYIHLMKGICAENGIEAKSKFKIHLIWHQNLQILR